MKRGKGRKRGRKEEKRKEEGEKKREKGGEERVYDRKRGRWGEEGEAGEG